MIAGVGVDLVRIERIQAAIARFGERFLNRCFTVGERAACADAPARLAARFAAKEAVAKSLGTGLRGMTWREIEVVTDASGKPQVSLHGGAAARAQALGVTGWEISLSHEGEYAVAFVTASKTGATSAAGEGQR